MSIAKDEVKYIAKLARLELTPTEMKKYQKQLGEILVYVGQLRKAKMKNIKSGLSHYKGEASLVNVFRQDESKQRSRKGAEKLIQQAPRQEKGLIKTKKILNIKTQKRENRRV